MSAWFKYDSRDAGPVAIGLIAPMLHSAIALTYGRVELTVTIGLIFVYWIVYTMLFYGYHHHAHTPFFSNRMLNRALDVVYSLGVNQPFSFYSYYHLRHHTESVLHQQNYSNILKHTPLLAYVATADLVGLRWLVFLLRAFGYRRAADSASISPLRSMEKPSWHFAKGDGPELVDVPFRPLFHYPAFLEEYVKVGAVRGHLPQMTLEACSIVAWHGTLLFLRPQAWAFMISLSLVLTLWRTWTDYSDHFGVNRKEADRSAFSCYARWFNAVTFNNGYHLEHHRYPGIHWTQLAKCRERMVPEAERPVAPFAQWISPFLPQRFSKRHTSD